MSYSKRSPRHRTFGDEYIKLSAPPPSTPSTAPFLECTMAISTPYNQILPYHGNLTEITTITTLGGSGYTGPDLSQRDVAIDGAPRLERFKLIERRCVAPPPPQPGELKWLCASRLWSCFEFIPTPITMPTSFTSMARDVMQHMTAFRTLIDAGITPPAGPDSAFICPADGDAGMVMDWVERRDLGGQPEIFDRGASG